MNAKEVDHLTRRLMKESIEQPSPSLNRRIMGLIRQRRSAEKTEEKLYVGRIPSPSILFLFCVIYLFVLGGGFYLWHLYGTGVEGKLLKPYLTILYVIATGIAFFFFYSQLDNWLFRRERQRQREA